MPNDVIRLFYTTLKIKFFIYHFALLDYLMVSICIKPVSYTHLDVNKRQAGGSVAFNFQSLQNNSQQLKLEWSSPYLFNLPFSPVARFNMYRRDSLFQDIRADVGASWLLSRMGEFKANFGSLSSSLLRCV